MGLNPKQTTYVHKVRLDDLENAKRIDNQGDQTNKESKGNIDHFSVELMQCEMKYISALRNRQDRCCDRDDSKLTGLALSGGGIRSAPFSLGVMQALASRNLLNRVDYLSTVSGGGHFAAVISWLLSKNKLSFGLNKDNFPFGTCEPGSSTAMHTEKKGRNLLRYMSEHVKFMGAEADTNKFSLLGVMLEGIFLNLVVWIPLIVLFFIFGLWFFSIYHPYEMIFLPKIMSDVEKVGVNLRLFGFELFLWIGLGLSILLMQVTLIHSIYSWLRQRLHGSILKKMSRYKKRGMFMTLLNTIMLFFLVGSLPIIYSNIPQEEWAPVGLVAILSGLVMTMSNFLKWAEDSTIISLSILRRLAQILFLIGVFYLFFLIAYGLAYWMVDNEWLFVAVLVMIMSSIVFGWFVNLNHISIHRDYRNRLMTLFPDISDALENESGSANGINTTRLSDFAYDDRLDMIGPYHIINTSVNLADSRDHLYRERGGDNFILSPLYCGCNATGWCRTEEFEDGGMTLATAVAISGAATNPKTRGEGLTRNRQVSSVKSLFNLGLGYWVKHPGTYKSRLFQRQPNHFYPGLYSFGSLLGWNTFNESRAFLQLGDGGHFDNTGIYELVRRRVRIIIACDSGEDTEFSFLELLTIIQRIEEDFGARIKMLNDASPDYVVPYKPDSNSPIYPQDTKFSQQGHIMGHVEYADGSEGWIIILKTTLTRDVSFKVKGYAALNKGFPFKSTIDQVFDKLQFEAYRELGYRLTINMLESTVPEGVSCEGLTSNTTIQENLEQFIKACTL